MRSTGSGPRDTAQRVVSLLLRDLVSCCEGMLRPLNLARSCALKPPASCWAPCQQGCMLAQAGNLLPMLGPPLQLGLSRPVLLAPAAAWSGKVKGLVYHACLCMLWLQVLCRVQQGDTSEKPACWQVTHHV